MVLAFGVGLWVVWMRTEATPPVDPIKTKALLSAGIAVAEIPAPGFPDEFRNVSLKCRTYAPVIRGNCIEAFEDAPKKGVKYAEADFRLCADGILVTGHDDELGGNCGTASTSTLEELRNCRLDDGRHIATLEQFLALDLREFYLDMKQTMPKEDEFSLQALTNAVEVIEASGKKPRVIVLVYDSRPAWLELLREHGIRMGLQRYPQSPEEALDLVREAAGHGFEMVSVHTDFITLELIQASNDLGVWHLAWYTGQPAPELWADMVAVGVGGLKTGYSPRVAEAVAGQQGL